MKLIYILPLAVELLMQNAHASYLRMVPLVEAKIDEASQSVEVSVQVTNEGDESANEVEVDLPALNQRHTISAAMTQNTSGKLNLKFSFAELGIQSTGEYGLVYRVLYKDGNFYPFSAPYTLKIVRPPAPSRILSTSFKENQGGKPLSIVDDNDAKLVIKNSARADVSIEKIEVVAPLEIEARWEDPITPFVLKPGEEKTFEMALTKQGALVGSTYRMGALTSGTFEGRHFIEESQLSVVMVNGDFNTRNLIGVIIGVLSLGTLGFWFWKRKRHHA